MGRQPKLFQSFTKPEGFKRDEGEVAEGASASPVTQAIAFIFSFLPLTSLNFS
jgi:hypothetical protein